MKDLKVLVVEDEKRLADGIAAYLAEEGQVKVAYTYEAAKGLLEKFPPHVVISDVRLSQEEAHSGLALLEWTKKHYPQTEFIIITGFGDTQMERFARKEGGLRFFHKPVDLDLLKELVHHISQKTQHRDRDDWTIPDGTIALSDKQAETYQRAYLAGDDRALDVILIGYRNLVFHIGLKWFSLPADTVEDIYQDVAIEVMTKISRIRNLRTFIIGTTMNLCKKWLSQDQRRAPLSQSLYELPHREAQGEHRLYQKELQEMLHHALKKLEPQHRKLLELLFDEGRSYKEIYEALGIPMGSIGPTRAKVLKKLQALISLH